MAANDSNPKQRQLDDCRLDGSTGYLTTQQGVRVDHTDDALTAGERGPTLLEDFHAREKITHFDHERIPERVVHARGAGAYGYFEPYDDWLAEYTAAKFLTTPGKQTPVFVRFSTVVGSRGSADTVRDVRGFATKFYTDQGNYDLVGNNFPVFFIQDGIKFPDLVHAVKPEPHNEIPQAQSAHDTLWDFVSLQPETLHTIMWLMSDRALPRSYRMMEGFGVHTFRLVNADGQGTFVKFHWKPRLGVHSLVWEECQKVAGKDPDFNRRDLWEAIEAGQYPEWEFGVQLVPESDEFNFGFDLLDATKIIPEEQVPVRPVGKMVLNRNPDNFFAETEQVAFHTANVVPGIDFTNDPLLQFRNFSYLDTQLIRLGGPNFAQLPVNRPVAEVHNNQRDGYGQHTIPRGRSSYYNNSLGGGCPALADDNVFRHYTQKVDGHKIRQRAESFQDHYSQARMFWKSMSAVEAKHIVAAYAFELGKVETPEIRSRVVDQLNRVDHDLATRVAGELGLPAPEGTDKLGAEMPPPGAFATQYRHRQRRNTQDRRAGRRRRRRGGHPDLHRGDAAARGHRRSVGAQGRWHAVRRIRRRTPGGPGDHHDVVGPLRRGRDTVRTRRRQGPVRRRLRDAFRHRGLQTPQGGGGFRCGRQVTAQGRDNRENRREHRRLRLQRGDHDQGCGRRPIRRLRRGIRQSACQTPCLGATDR
ncbi:catalase family protein [Mycobacterium kansasii 824]|nr:catalase family protein [Mycobacterium kansasii 824]